MASKAAYGPNPNAGVNVNADHGWGGYQWPGGVPGVLLGTTDYQQVNGAKQRIRVTVRRELVGLFTLAFALADRKHNYQIWATRNGETWGPWSYENRPIGGTSTASNHSRAKAIDVNAPSNPQSYTFQSDLPPGLVADWERIGLCWGGRYEGGTKFDTMHFEYGYSPAEVAGHTALAQQLLGEDPGNPGDPGDEDMPLTDADVAKIAAAVVPAVAAAVWDRIIQPDGAKEAAWSILLSGRNSADAAKGALDSRPAVLGKQSVVEALAQTRNDMTLVKAKVVDGGTPTPPAGPPTYTVVAGDTLSKIAAQFGVSVTDLVTWNGLANPDAIEVGQVLRVGKA